jgi:F0F1-type ATP synthase alpha subunit
MSIGERLRDRGFDTTISFDDSPKHSKSYRQISSIPAKIPSRDASPSDIPNIHASISERRGKLKICYFSGSISASPINPLLYIECNLNIILTIIILIIFYSIIK